MEHELELKGLKMLINKIHTDMIASKQTSDNIAKNLLVTLYAESIKVGKDKRNGASTDEEVIATVKKFITNAGETARLLRERNQDDSAQQHEIKILSDYLPRQLDRSTLETIIKQYLLENTVSGPKAIGQIMAFLKANYSGQYDGKMASDIVKSL